jgi:hypothetical protein
MSTDTKEIELLFPQGKTITLKGKEHIIKPFGFGKFPKLLRLLKGIKVDYAPKSLEETIEVAKEIAKTSVIMDIITDNSDRVVEVCELATNQKKEFFDDLPPDEAVMLLHAIIEVNTDFFIKRLQPQVLSALSSLSGSVGGMLSQDSSQPAIA